MLKLRINPIVAKDLKNIRDYIAEDNEEYAAKTIKVSAKYCYVTRKLRLHQNDRCKRFTLF